MCQSINQKKWNFLGFQPGLVGGHCIGVDPYYLAYRAEQAGFHTQIISAGRRINDSVGRFIAYKSLMLLTKSKKNNLKYSDVSGSRFPV